MAAEYSSAAVTMGHLALKRAIQHAEANDLVPRTVATLVDTPKARRRLPAGQLSLSPGRRSVPLSAVRHSHGAMRGVEEPARVLLKQHAQLCIGEARSMQERIQVRLDMVVAPSAVLVETHLHADVVAD
jgi:hypothetical protein